MVKSLQSVESLAKFASLFCKVPHAVIAYKNDYNQWANFEHNLSGFDPEWIRNTGYNECNAFEAVEEKILPAPLKAFLNKNKYKFYIELPFASPYGKGGALCLFDKKSRDFDSEEKQAIQEFILEISKVIELKRENDALSKQVNVLNYFLTSSKKIMAVVDDSTYLIEKVNKEFCKLMNFEFKKGLNSSFIEIFPEEQHDKVRNYLSQLKEGAFHEFEALIKQINNDEIYYKFKATKKDKKLYIQVRDITEKKKINQALIQNEKRYRRLSEFAFENIAIYDEGKIVDCNSTFTKTFGYEHADVKGMSLFHFFPRIYRDLINKDSPLTSGKRLETMCVRKDSSTFPAEIMIKTIQNDGAPINAIAIRDNTERKKLENELLKSTLFQKAILDSSSFAIISTDFNGLIKTFNNGAEKLIGYKSEDVVDKLHIEGLHIKEELKSRAIQLSEELGKQVKPNFEVFVEKLQVLNVDEHEWSYKKKNKEAITASLAVTTLKDNLGEITGYLFMGTDISDKKKAEAEIVDKSQMLNAIIAHMPVIVFRTDSKGVLTQLIGKGLKNPEAQRAALLDKNVFETYPEAQVYFEKAYLGEYVTFEIQTEYDHEDSHFEIFIFPDVANKGGLIGFALDITDKTIAELKLKDSADHLVKVNKELDQFAYIVSHDLKAPLRGIATLSEYIEEDLGESIGPDIAHNMAILRNRAQRMQNLIDGILSYSRVGRIKVAHEEIKLNELVKDIISVINAPSHFNIEIAQSLPVIISNPTCLEQIFTNLISNAIKYHDKPEGKVIIDFEQDQKFYKFSVTDDGPGISPEFHEKVFVIFQTLESRDTKESTGVGLAIVKKIVEEQGGDIWVESDGKLGSKFVFTLPKVNL